ncbi:unnamed protein product [Closterium sp. Yama58-4]|nr:unnamed protein product [Closterium sp. Yama58-4]
MTRPSRAQPLTQPVVPRRYGRIDATRGAEGGSGDHERPLDESAGATAADDASEKGPRATGEDDSNGAAANSEGGSIGDAARRIWDVSGRDLVQVALEASRATDGPRFLAPCGVRRELPLLVYLPGLDGTVRGGGVWIRHELQGIGHRLRVYIVRCKLPLLVYLPGLDGTVSGGGVGKPPLPPPPPPPVSPFLSYPPTSQGVFLERHLEGLKPCYDVALPLHSRL